MGALAAGTGGSWRRFAKVGPMFASSCEFARAGRAAILRAIELGGARQPLVVATRVELVRTRQPARAEGDFVGLPGADGGVVDEGGLEVIVARVGRSGRNQMEHLVARVARLRNHRAVAVVAEDSPRVRTGGEAFRSGSSSCAAPSGSRTTLTSSIRTSPACSMPSRNSFQLVNP